MTLQAQLARVAIHAQEDRRGDRVAGSASAVRAVTSPAVERSGHQREVLRHVHSGGRCDTRRVAVLEPHAPARIDDRAIVTGEAHLAPARRRALACVRRRLDQFRRPAVAQGGDPLDVTRRTVARLARGHARAVIQRPGASRLDRFTANLQAAYATRRQFDDEKSVLTVEGEPHRRIETDNRAAAVAHHVHETAVRTKRLHDAHDTVRSPDQPRPVDRDTLRAIEHAGVEAVFAASADALRLGGDNRDAAVEHV